VPNNFARNAGRHERLVVNRQHYYNREIRHAFVQTFRLNGRRRKRHTVTSASTG
jgi:hypothetical protein